MTFLVWTRVGSEAGEPLSCILSRKEAERVAAGRFTWGVGNSSAEIAAFIKDGAAIDVIFSLMAGKPKRHDAEPDRVIRWRAYRDARGKCHRFQDHERVTSKGRARHYALICRSDGPIEVESLTFDPNAYSNLSGRQIAASQVTALARHVPPYELKQSLPKYTKGFRARLIDWVELSEPEEWPRVRLCEQAARQVAG
jgi:hypothetical protein